MVTIALCYLNPRTGWIVSRVTDLIGFAPTPREDFLATASNLSIHDMEQRHAGLTKAIAASYTEAAKVCLDRHHQPPASFCLAKYDSRLAATVEWQSSDARTRSAWAQR